MSDFSFTTVAMVKAALLSAIEADRPGIAAVWGVSANTRSWWRDDDAARIGYLPVDDAETYASDMSAATDDAISARYQGGAFCAKGYMRRDRE
jgi:uronate dehydrogenase